MLLTKKKLHKIRNTKLQSRKRYKKKGEKEKDVKEIIRVLEKEDH